MDIMVTQTHCKYELLQALPCTRFF